MNLKEQFFKTCEYRITEGGEYQWHCYGSRAYCLDSWNGDQDGNSFTIIFDTETQEVYELQAHDYSHNRAYRWINPDFKDQHAKEAQNRNCELDQAWDDLKYVDLDLTEDFFEKMSAIYRDEDYDTRIKVPIDFSDEELLKYMTMAHEQDITFNQFIEKALREAIAHAEKTHG